MLMPAFYLAEIILVPFLQLKKQIFLNNCIFYFDKNKVLLFVPPEVSWDCKIIWELKEYILTCNICINKLLSLKTFLK